MNSGTITVSQTLFIKTSRLSTNTKYSDMKTSLIHIFNNYMGASFAQSKLKIAHPKNQ